MSDYLSHPAWSLTEDSGAGRLIDKYYPCCSEPYPYMDYNLTFTARQSDDFDVEDKLIQGIMSNAYNK